MIDKQNQRWSELILGGNFSTALEEIEKFQPENLHERRIMLHRKAQALIHLGDLESAKSSLLMAQKHCGENIAILIDLAMLYYQTGEVFQWRSAVADLRARYHAVETRLSPKTKIQTLIAIGKFLEEDGHLSEAARHFGDAVYFAQHSHQLNLRIFGLIQQIRVEALYIRSPELADLYKQLLTSDARGLSWDLSVEREHTLMLAELELIGPIHSWSRVQLLLDDGRLSVADRRLIITDYVAECLLRQIPLSEEIRSACLALTSGDAFETEIQSLLKLGESSFLQLQRLNTLAVETSWASHLRLLTIHHQCSTDPQLKAELASKLALLLGTLDPYSRQHWMRRIQREVFTDELKIQVNRQSRQVLFQSKELDLSRKRTLFSLLTLLCEKREAAVDDLIRWIWNSDFSPEHLHRLRMSVHRLNQLIFELSAIPRAFEMTSERIGIRPSLTIEAVG